MKNIYTLPVGIYQANCYLIQDQESVLVVDPGAKADRLIEKIRALGGAVSGIVLTHGHFDHIGAVDALVAQFNCPVYMHEADVELITDPDKNYSLKNRQVTLRSKVRTLQPGFHQIGPFGIEVIDVPGHSEGSILVQWNNHLFTGDMLFKDSVGRTDLYNSSNSKMKQSIQMVKTMDPNLLVYPGHGPSTTLADELQNNPFLQ
ncbi:MAG: MBL fold metallo-hydrolase [Erysipelotrichaceae bacterium]